MFFLKRKQLPAEHHSSDQKIQQRINFLQRQIRASKVATLLFSLASLAAAVNFRFLPPVSSSLRQLLGAPPPLFLVNLALIIYAFSALVLTLGRINSGTSQFHGWPHLGYITAFYIFYYYSQVLPGNFWQVFIAGLTIFALEDYRIWTVCSEALKKEQQRLAMLPD